MLREELEFRKEKAILLTVDFSGPIEAYALAWLKLTNNARDYSNMIWKIANERGSDNVYVICRPRSASAVKDFLNGIYAYYDEKEDKVKYIGVVKEEEEIVVGVPVYDYMSDRSCCDEKWEEEMDSAISWWMDVE